MGSKHADLFAALAAPFGREEVKSRPQNGRQLSYVTARTVMNRLDTVLGPENWWDEYVPAEHSVLCRLTIRLPDGTVLTKCDAGGCAGMSDPGDDDKSGYSDSFKRAAVKFGVGRYLYRDGVPSYGHAQAAPAAAPAPAPSRAKVRTNAQGGKWGAGVPAAEAPQAQAPAQATATKAPRSGRALFAWANEQAALSGHDLIKYLGIWGPRQGFPARIVDWNSDQAIAGWEEVRRKLESIEDAE